MKFVYLIQAKKNFISTFGHANNDFFVLTWKEKCECAIYYPDSTWTEGRNRLFEEVKDLDYDYYIFMDEDVILKAANDLNCGNIFWEFERLLEKYQPAIGMPLYLECPYLVDSQEEGEISTVYSFDACFNAIRKDALHKLLPYNPVHDKESWWYSQLYFVHTARILYPKEIVHFNNIHMTNPVHGKYPQGRDFKSKDEIFKKTIKPEYQHLFRPCPTWTENMGFEKNDNRELEECFNMETDYWQSYTKI
jgi:hypothetical protein